MTLAVYEPPRPSLTDRLRKLPLFMQHTGRHRAPKPERPTFPRRLIAASRREAVPAGSPTAGAATTLIAAPDPYAWMGIGAQRPARRESVIRAGYARAVERLRREAPAQPRILVRADPADYGTVPIAHVRGTSPWETGTAANPVYDAQAEHARYFALPAAPVHGTAPQLTVAPELARVTLP